MEQMRERDELRDKLAVIASGFIPLVGRSTFDLADAMMPEIDRRVAEEKAKLLERFDEYKLEQIISDSLDMDWLPRDAARAIQQGPCSPNSRRNNSHEQG